jgi:hypothetical protein
VDTSKRFEILVNRKMTFHDWWKERVYGVEYRTGAVFANNPVLVVLVKD